MTEIRLHNTKTRKKEVFKPLDDKNVRMYVCGPTVYDRAHLGNARPVLVFDVLYRLLRHRYGADHVTYVRNFTDVDDRINATALDRKAAGDDRSLEELIHERSDETIAWYNEDMGALGALLPDAEPRATEFIPQMVAMIEGLIAKDHAYEAEGHVLFAVESYKEYGALSGRSVDDMIAGARVEVAPYKRNPMDFVLWKPSTDDLPGWSSPWGRGRPGWHIECSAMAYELLGAEFDIHGGGNDLMFPHHENEIAQSKCSGHGFAQVWMHNEMLQVEGKKMSKSLGNFFTVRDLLDQGVPGEVIRFVMLSTHYRKPMDWTERKREQALKTLTKWRTLCYGKKPSKEFPQKIANCLADDLNVSSAMYFLRQYARDGRAELLLSGARLLGLLTDEMADWFVLGRDTVSDNEKFNYIVFERQLLRKNARWKEADFIRDALIDIGGVIADSKENSAGYLEPAILLNQTMNRISKAYSSNQLEELSSLVDFAKSIGIADPLPNGKIRAWSQREATKLAPWIDAQLDSIKTELGNYQ